jgi:serine phosphatase RsbU (regulator of sigma subunit)
LYTDGVTGARNRQGEFFEVEGLVRFIAGRLGHPSQELCDSMVAALLDYQNPLDPGDDITLVAVRAPA